MCYFVCEGECKCREHDEIPKWVFVCASGLGLYGCTFCLMFGVVCLCSVSYICHLCSTYGAGEFRPPVNSTPSTQVANVWLAISRISNCRSPEEGVREQQPSCAID